MKFFSPYKLLTSLIILVSVPASLFSQAYQLNCDFTVTANACVQQQVVVTYTGGASANATFVWAFDGAVVLSGEGQGPYTIKWESPGEKHITLSITLETQTCTATRATVVVARPEVFTMTGGGTLIVGGDGVIVGLSGSQPGIIYKLRLNGQYTGITVVGTGQEISFGPQTLAGNYTAVAKVDGSDCLSEMEGVAVITTNSPPESQNICMVTFDTASGNNKVIWNKFPSQQIAYYSIYRESYQNNIFTRIADIPYSSLSTFVDTASSPLVRSYRYKLSITNLANVESEKSNAHKTIHLNINPGMYGYNLIWNPYAGFEFLTYRIHRKLGSGPWEVIDSVASNVDSYTDVFTTTGLAFYYIEVLRPEPCNPSLKNESYSSVSSNIAASSPLGIETRNIGGITMFPNPVKDCLKISLPNQAEYLAQVLRADGSIVYQNKINGLSAQLDLSGLSSGVYIVKLCGANDVFIQKVIKN
jgi:hypothetical protein